MLSLCSVCLGPDVRFYKDTSLAGLIVTLMTSFNLHYLFRDPQISNDCPILSCWREVGAGLQLTHLQGWGWVEFQTQRTTWQVASSVN